MATQIIRPAGAGYETAWVLAACALVVASAAAFIGVRTAGVPVRTMAEHQIDARRDLTPAEQGLYADLRIAFDELSEDTLSIEELAELGIAPFVADMSHERRGGHVWQRLVRGAQVAYLGVSREPAVAGTLLLVMGNRNDGGHVSTHPHPDAGEPNIWLHRSQLVSAPSQIDADSLFRTGWRQIVAQFDAGVTRERRTSHILKETFE